MFRDLFVNVSILISSIFVGNIFFQKHRISPSAPFPIRMLLGFLAGCLGVLLMLFTIHVTPEVLLDLRHIAIALAAIYGGMLSSLFATAIIGAARVALFGVNPASLSALAGIVVSGLLCGILSCLTMPLWHRWLVMNTLCLVVMSGLFVRFVHDFLPYLYYWGTSLVGGIIAFYVTDYINRSNQLFRQLKEYSTKDFLTGLNNVRYFDTILNHSFTKVKEEGERFSLLLIDIDHFKQVNDTYGHPAGDVVLQELGRILTNASRSFDTASRNGGEEFSLLLPGCTQEQAVQVAERIRAIVQKHPFLLPDGQTINLSVSIGVAACTQATPSTAHLLQLADDALYKAKRSGRNRVCC